jgi:hypothetical protein
MAIDLRNVYALHCPLLVLVISIQEYQAKIHVADQLYA